MSSLFEKTAINNMTLNNRFVRSATFESMANPDGSCTPDLIGLTGDLAEGEVGLIITGYAYISKIGKARPNQTGVHNDAMLNGLKDMVDEGLADYVSLCRPLIREPHLIRRWKSGDVSRATCISCNECFKPVRAGKGVYCVTEAKLKAKRKRT